MLVSKSHIKTILYLLKLRDFHGQSIKLSTLDIDKILIDEPNCSVDVEYNANKIFFKCK